MFPLASLIQTLTGIPLPTGYYSASFGKSVARDNVNGCCLEHLKLSEEEPPEAEEEPPNTEGLVIYLLVAFAKGPNLRWDEKKTPAFFRKRGSILFHTRKMLIHVLQSTFCLQKLKQADIKSMRDINE